MPSASARLRVHGDREKLLAEDVVEQADGAVQERGLPDFGPRHGEDVADEHVLEVLALGGRLAHRENRRGRRDGVADSDDRFLRNPRAAGRAWSRRRTRRGT